MRRIRRRLHFSSCCLDASHNRYKEKGMMMKKTRDWITAAVAIAAGLSVGSAYADTCSQLAAAGLTDARLKTALRTVVPPAGEPNGGLGLSLWVTPVAGSGIAFAVSHPVDRS